MFDTVKSEGSHWNRFEMKFSMSFEYRAKVKGKVPFAEGISKATGSEVSSRRTDDRL